jgi:hypothetical protein
MRPKQAKRNASTYVKRFAVVCIFLQKRCFRQVSLEGKAKVPKIRLIAICGRGLSYLTSDHPEKIASVDCLMLHGSS